MNICSILFVTRFLAMTTKNGRVKNNDIEACVELISTNQEHSQSQKCNKKTKIALGAASAAGILCGFALWMYYYGIDYIQNYIWTESFKEGDS